MPSKLKNALKLFCVIVFTSACVGGLASFALPAKLMWLDSHGFFMLTAFAPLFLSIEFYFCHFQKKKAALLSVFTCFFSVWAIEIGFFHWGIVGIQTFLALDFWPSFAMAAFVFAIHSLAILPAFLLYISARYKTSKISLLCSVCFLMPIFEHYSPRLFYYTFGSFLSLTKTLSTAPSFGGSSVLTGFVFATSLLFARLFLRKYVKSETTFTNIYRSISICTICAASLSFFATLADSNIKNSAEENKKQDRALNLLLVQPNIALSKQLTPADVVDPFQRSLLENEQNLANLKDLVQITKLGIETSPENPDLIVWPESLIPAAFDSNAALRIELENALERLSVPVLLHYNRFSTKTFLPTKFDKISVVESASLAEIRPEQWSSSTLPYQKQMLMPFGEFLPWRQIWRFLLPQETLQRMPETDSIPQFGSNLPLEFLRHNEKIYLGVNICMDGISPQLVRAQAELGSDVIINLSNLEWMSSAASEFVYGAILRIRALELGVPVVYVNNSGGTAVFGAKGEELLHPLPHGKSTSAFVKIRLQTHSSKERSFSNYVRWGDAPLWGMACVGLFSLIRAFYKSNSKKISAKIKKGISL